jgi:hypothetical protein
VAELENMARWNTRSVAGASISSSSSPICRVADGEIFYGQRQGCLIIYDDLSKHAWSYRQISILRRPPGREAIREIFLSAFQTFGKIVVSMKILERFDHGFADH